MVSWLGRQLAAYLMRGLNNGNTRRTLRMDARDVRFRFPGNNSWSGEHRGKEELARWYERFVRIGIQIFPDEVVVKGFPWRQTMCVRGHDYFRAPSGELVYENRYVIWGHLRWGLLRDYEVYEDTEKTAEFDRWLAEHEPALAAA